MAERVVKERIIKDNDDTADNDVVVRERGENILSRIIWIVAGVILFLLAFRFLLSLLGANRNNAFADFIYDVSYPFAAPFFGLFQYDNINYGVSRFEIYTLVAMLVYAAIAWLLSRIFNLNRD